MATVIQCVLMFISGPLRRFHAPASCSESRYIPQDFGPRVANDHDEKRPMTMPWRRFRVWSMTVESTISSNWTTLGSTNLPLGDSAQIYIIALSKDFGDFRCCLRLREGTLYCPVQLGGEWLNYTIPSNRFIPAHIGHSLPSTDTASGQLSMIEVILGCFLVSPLNFKQFRVRSAKVLMNCPTVLPLGGESVLSLLLFLPKLMRDHWQFRI